MAARGRPLPLAMKEEIKQRYLRGETPTAIARALSLSRMTVYKFAKRVCTEYMERNEVRC